jgi:hypothetical protein
MAHFGTNKHYPCGHPRTPDNMRKAGIGRDGGKMTYRCRTCHVENARLYRARKHDDQLDHSTILPLLTELRNRENPHDK